MGLVPGVWGGFRESIYRKRAWISLGGGGGGIVFLAKRETHAK
jgi:hypothetical protein